MARGAFPRIFRRGLMACLAAAIVAVICFRPDPGGRVVARDFGGDGSGRVTLLSQSYTIDRLYQSMMGPSSHHEHIRLVEGKKSLLWLTGIRCELVDLDGKSAASQDFFCHSNLTFSAAPDPHRAEPEGRTASAEGRLFTLVPGRMDLSLPEGFGVPVYSDELLDCFTMSLNLNHRGQPVKFKFRTSVQFAQAGDTSRAIKPLFRRALYSYEPIDRNSPHAMCMGGDSSGATCGPFIGKAASNAFHASLGKTNTVHWLIPPGHFQSRVDVTDQFDLPYDTTAHYVTAHLHPYGKSVSLVDATNGTTLFTIRSRDFADRLGVEFMEEWSSTQGLQLIKGHRYELVTEYLNPTDKPIDAMSIMYVYARDKTFQSSALAAAPR